MAGLALLLFTATQAKADSVDAFDSEIFTPDLSVCTSSDPCDVPFGVDDQGNIIMIEDEHGGLLDVTHASTTRAGANPQLTIRMEKASANHCLDWSTICPADQMYIEQTLKKMAIHLPPGLLGDVNAAPYCDPEQRWIPRGVGDRMQSLRWFCKDHDAFVGAGSVLASQCFLLSAVNPDSDVACLGSAPGEEGYLPPGIAMPARFLIYNDRPRLGEQGHLVSVHTGLRKG